MSQAVTIKTIDALPSVEICREIAEFLAQFVQNGELESPLSGDDRVETWQKRLEWWWHSNPFAKPGLPLAWLMRDSESKRVVGFHGFIPHDYEIDGEVVPSLITTTFFVEPGVPAALDEDRPEAEQTGPGLSVD